MIPAFPRPIPGLPSADGGRLLGGTEVSNDSLAREVADGHANALSARRLHDLTSEKFSIWIDGEGDNQRADIYGGTRVAVPRRKDEYWVQDNLLRPIVDNQVAFHTSNPLLFAALGRNDAKSRATLEYDRRLVNHISITQRWNALGAQAVYMADVAGFCPLHAMWRDDIGYDAYEPLYTTPDVMQQMGLRPPQKGIIDCWVGNPFDTTFNEGAKRDSFQLMRYGRVLPAQLVRERFQTGVEGSDRFTSGSVFSRIKRAWYGIPGLNTHGTAAITSAQKGQEMLALVCQETAPGTDPQWPTGRLTIVALQGANDTSRNGASRGTPVLLWDGPLPAGRFSAELVYTAVQFDDVHGNRWIAPLADLQQQLNITLSNARSWEQKMNDAPIFYAGTLDDDGLTFGGMNLIEMAPGSSAPTLLTLPFQLGAYYQQKAAEIREEMFRIGGFQAASRGEGGSGDSGVKVQFLAQQDDTVHGPARTQIHNTFERFAGLCHALFRENADVPWVLDTLGEDEDQLAEDYIDRTKVSQTPPTFKVAPSLGGTPEAQANRITQLVQMKGADGKPFMTVEEGRRRWPEGSLFDQDVDPADSQKKRAKRMASACRRAAQVVRQATGFQGVAFSDPQVQMLGQQVAQTILAGQPFPGSQAPIVAPPLPTDNPQLCMALLVEVTQDDTEDALARVAALVLWQHYQQVVQQMLAAQQQAALAHQAQAEAVKHQNDPQRHPETEQRPQTEQVRPQQPQPPQGPAGPPQFGRPQQAVAA